MNDPVRPSPGFASAPSASAPSGVLATVPNPPPELARLPAGTAVRGVVVGEDGHGHLLVRTDLGQLSVATKAHLAPNTEVILQLRSSGTQLHVLLMQVRTQPSTARAPVAALPLGQTPAPPVAGFDAPGDQRAGTGTAQAPPPSGPPPLGPPDRLNLGQSVRAVVQGPPASPGVGAAAPATGPLPGAALSPLPPGTVLQVRILSISPPAVGSPAAGPTTVAPAGMVAAQAPAGSGPILGLAGPGTTPAGPSPVQPVATGGTGPTLAAAAPATAPGAPGALGAPGASLGPQGAALPGAARPAGPTPGAPSAASPAVLSGTPIVPGSTVASGVPDGAQVPSAAPAGPGAGGGAPGGHGSAAPSPVPQGAPAPARTATATTAGSADRPGAAFGGAPATGPAIPAPAAAGPRIFAGQVTGNTHAGHPVVSTALGTMTLEIPANLPLGARLTLERPVEGSPGGTATDGGLAVPRSLGHTWPALEQALELLREQPGQGGGGSAIPLTVPQPGPRLASGILFVLAALTGGNLGGWLGAETVQILRAAGRGGLIERMTQDLGQMGRMADGVGGDWRLLPIPLWDGDQVRQLRLFLRQRDKREQGKGRDQREATRFILELEMSRLGEMQFDGLVRAKRFDLMLRTRAPLPHPMREDIRQIFQDANDAAGYSGSLGFQASRDWRFVPVERPGGNIAGSGLVV